MSAAAPSKVAMNAVRRAWLRELGVDRVWGGGAVGAPQAAPAAVEKAMPGAMAAPQAVVVVPATSVANTAVMTSARTTGDEGARIADALPADVVAEVTTEPLARVAADVVAREPAARPVADVVADPDEAWAVLQQEIAGCVSCGLCKGRTQTVFGTGVMRARWMIIGEAPGEQEDLKGQPFVGRSGKLLDNMLASVAHARQKDVFIANVIKCRPPGNRDPLPDEVAACSPYLMRQIALVQPEMILVVGRFAAQTLLGTEANIGSLRGRRHEVTVEGRTIPVVVSYHPAYLLRSPQEKTKAWQDLRLAVAVGGAGA